MSNMKGKFENAISESGTGFGLEWVLGKSFIFGDDDDHMIAGKVSSLGCGPQEGVSLYVTPTRFRGKDVQKMIYMNGRWCLIFKNGEIKSGHLLWL